MASRIAIRDQLLARRDHMLAAFKKHVSLDCFKFKTTFNGAFYLFPNVEDLYGRTRSDGKVQKKNTQSIFFLSFTGDREH